MDPAWEDAGSKGTYLNALLSAPIMKHNETANYETQFLPRDEANDATMLSVWKILLLATLLCDGSRIAKIKVLSPLIFSSKTEYRSNFKSRESEETACDSPVGNGSGTFSSLSKIKIAKMGMVKTKSQPVNSNPRIRSGRNKIYVDGSPRTKDDSKLLTKQSATLFTAFKSIFVFSTKLIDFIMFETPDEPSQDT